jgi:DNA-binding CsgD family transcriptional regulator
MSGMSGNSSSSHSTPAPQDGQADLRRPPSQSLAPGPPYRLVLEQATDASGLAARFRCNYETAHRISERLGAIADLQDRVSRQPPVPAVSPVAAMHRLVVLEDEMRARLDQFTRETADAYASILTAAHAADLATTAGSDEHMGERVSGMATLRARAGQLVAGAAESACVIAASPADDLLGGDPDVTPADHVALTAGVRLRKIYPYAVLLDDQLSKRVQEMAEAGSEVRLTARLPPLLVVVDGQIAVIPVMSGGCPDGGVIIRQRTIVAAMMALFAKCWEQSQPLADTETEELSPVETAVIKLLATGAKDDAIARQLGTSVRTIRRIVGNLMRRAGVNSRFAFGVWAAYTTAC